jgi:hypothetical protein
MRAIAACLLALLAAGPARGEYQRQPFPFYHEDYGTRELDVLRQTYDFEEYVAAGKTELERMILLQDWVYRRVAYGGAPQYVDLRDSLTILSLAVQGEEFWCNNMAAVFMQAAVSLGWTARYVFLRSPEGDAHITNDIWSNDLKKWIMLDATWNLHLERDGVVLSVPEVRAVWEERRMGDLTYVFGAGRDERRYTVADMPIERSDSKLWHWWPVDERWISFTHLVAYVMRNDFFGIERGNGGSIWSGIVTLRGRPQPGDPFWEFGGKPVASDLRALYHDVNRVDVRLVPSYLPASPPVRAARRPASQPEVRLWLDAYGPENYTPNLDHFLVQVNGGAWLKSGAEHVFKPVAGVNTIRARVVNKFGVQGPVTEYQVAWAPGTLPVAAFPLGAWETPGAPLAAAWREGRQG